MKNTTLKAGLVGGAIGGGLILLSTIPLPALSCTLILTATLSLVIAGVLAVRFAARSEPPRFVSPFRSGAFAGLIAGLIITLASGVSAGLQSLLGLSAIYMANLPSQIIETLAAYEVDPQTLVASGSLTSDVMSSLVCFGVIFPVIGAVLGGLGGALYGGVAQRTAQGITLA